MDTRINFFQKMPEAKILKFICIMFIFASLSFLSSSVNGQVALSETIGSVNLVRLEFVRKTDNGFEKINEIRYGKPFYIETEFYSEPEDKILYVDLVWGAGAVGIYIENMGNNDNKVIFRSKVIKVFKTEVDTTPPSPPTGLMIISGTSDSKVGKVLELEKKSLTDRTADSEYEEVVRLENIPPGSALGATMNAPYKAPSAEITVIERGNQKVKLVSAVVSVLPVEYDENKIPDVFEVIIASRLFEGSVPKGNVKLKANFYDKTPGDDSEVLMVADNLSTLLLEEPLNIQAENIYNNPRPIQRSTVTSNRFIRTLDNDFTYSGTNALTCSSSQYAHSNNQQRFTSVHSSSFTVMNASFHNDTLLTTDTYPRPFVRTIHNDIPHTPHTDDESDRKSARTNSDGLIFTKVRLRGNEAENTLKVHHEIDDPEFLEEAGLTGHEEAAKPSNALLRDIDKGEDGNTNDFLFSVVAEIGAFIESPSKIGFITSILPDKNDVTRWVIDRYLDALVQTEKVKPLYFAIKGVLGGSEKDSRAAMLGISFGIPNGSYAFGEGEWEDLRFVFYDGWVMLLKWLNLDPRTPTSSGVLISAGVASGNLEKTILLYLEHPTIKRIKYVISPEFRIAIGLKLVPIVLKLEKIKGQAQLFIMAQLCKVMRDGWITLLPNPSDIAVIFDFIFPNYSKTIGGDLAVNVMGYKKDSSQYASNGFGYTSAFLSIFISAQVLEDAVLAEFTAGVGNVGRWVIKLGLRSHRVKIFFRILQAIPLINKVTTVKTFCAMANILEKIPDPKRAKKIIDALEGKDISKFGKLIYKHIDKYPGEPDKVTSAIARIVSGVHEDVVGDTMVALARVTDGRRITMSLKEIESVGKGIGKLKKLKPELDFNKHLLGIDGHGKRLPDQGFTNLVKSFSTLDALDDDGMKGFLKLVSKVDTDPTKAVKTTEKILDIVTPDASGSDDVLKKISGFTDDNAFKGIGKLTDIKDSTQLKKLLMNQTYTDDVIEKTFGLLGKKSDKLSGLSEDGLEGLFKVVKNIDPDTTEAARIAEKILDLDAHDADKVLSKLYTFTDNDAFKGVKEIVDEVDGVNFIKTVAEACDDDIIEATFKARHIKVYDEANLAHKVGKYLQGVKDLWQMDTINGGGIHKLIKAYNTSETLELIEQGQRVTISGFAVLKEGSSRAKFGRFHIFDEVRGSGMTRAQEIIRAGYQGITNNDGVYHLIKETVRSGQPTGLKKIKAFPHRDGGNRLFRLIMADGAPGSIHTVYPGPVVP
jgi:hypothetical protein